MAVFGFPMPSLAGLRSSPGALTEAGALPQSALCWRDQLNKRESVPDDSHLSVPRKPVGTGSFPQGPVFVLLKTKPLGQKEANPDQ